MDISKMYCRVDSEHFDEFVKLVGEQFGLSFSKRALSLSKLSDCKTVAISYYFRKEGTVEYSGDNSYWDLEYNYTEFTGSWTIYNNAKPMSDLTDNQAAELFNWWRNGGVMEVLFSDEGWPDVDPIWGIGSIYRAKPKSERELFIEAADYFIDCGDDAAAIAGKMFDAGFKAPKGGE